MPLKVTKWEGKDPKFKGFQLSSTNETNIAKGTAGPRHWVLWLIQHLKFKAEASTSFKILVTLQLGFVWQRSRNTWKNFDKPMYQLKQIYVATLTNPYKQLREIHLSIFINPCNNLEKYNKLSKIEKIALSEWVTRQGNDRTWWGKAGLGWRGR